jgi:hypothetical protein
MICAKMSKLKKYDFFIFGLFFFICFGRQFCDGGGTATVLPPRRDTRLAPPAAREPEHVCGVQAALEKGDGQGAGVGAV